MTSAQLAQIATLQDLLHEATSSSSFNDLCVAVLGVVQARPDIDPERLTDLSNELGRVAWDEARARPAYLGGLRFAEGTV